MSVLCRINSEFLPRRCWRWLAALLFGVVAGGLFSSVAWAQYRFDHWTTDDGLPQNSIFGITQTPEGYLWLATLDGIARFDGVRFLAFDKGNTKGIVSNRCTSLFEDAGGALWIGTEDSGVMRYRAGVFTAALTTAEGLPHNQVGSIQSDHHGGLWINTANGRAHWRDGKVIRIIPANAAHYVGRSGTEWRLDEAGLHRVLTGQPISRLIPLPNYQPLRQVLYAGVSFYEDRDGNLWIGLPEFGVYRVSDSQATFYSEKDGMPKTRIVNAIYQDQEGAIWFGTQDRGALCFRQGRFTVYTTADGLSSNSIKSIFQDREGTLWLGTWDRGLVRVSRQFMKTYSARDGLINNNIYPIYQDRSGRVWVGTMGLSVLHDGRFTSYDERDGLHHKNIQALAEDREGRIWIGVVGGIFCFQNGRFNDYTPLVGDIAVQAIHQDHAGTFWFGTNKGLFKWPGGAMQPLIAQQGLPGNDVKVIHESPDGTLWIGTYDGLAKIQSGKTTVYTAAAGLAGNRVRSLYEEADGTLWIGTYDDGLSRFKDGRFFSFKVEHGLHNGGVFQILEDARANFWISCNRGIYRVSKQQLNDFAAGRIPKINSIAYGKQDGMLNIECNGGRQPAGIKAGDGKLWFPTQEGAVVIDPEATQVNPLPPPVVIESVIVDRASVPFQNSASGIEIKPGQANLEINYAGLSYIRAEQVRFKYKLRGQDQDWVDAGTRRAAYYPYLPPGAYTFQVIAANSDGIWNEAGATVRVIVLPPFYRTWWFMGWALLGLAGLITLIYRRRVARLRKDHAVKEAFSRQLLESQEAFSRQLLESQEAERKRIAGELHDGLGQSLVIIKNRALHSLTEPDDHDRAIEQIEEIAEAATHAILEAREIAYNLRPFHIDRLGLTAALGAMINRAGQDSLHFTTELDSIDGLLAPEQEINFYRIVQECLNNIIKHARASAASVTIKRHDRMIELTIRDNGRGFTPGAREESANGSGFGLLGLTERARILGGVLAITSAPGHGTTIQLEVAVAVP